MKQFDNFAVPTLHTLLSYVEEAISIVNTKGVMLYWNEAAEKMYDIKKEDIIGRNVQEFFQRKIL